LPQGVKAYGILLGTISGASDPEGDRVPVFANPLYWETPITDQFTVLWWPLPLGFKWQAYQDDDNRIGIKYVLGFFFNSGEVAYRRKLAADHALEVSIQSEDLVCSGLLFAA
jgi:hypothetical protein